MNEKAVKEATRSLVFMWANGRTTNAYEAVSEYVDEHIQDYVNASTDGAVILPERPIRNAVEDALSAVCDAATAG